MLVLYRWLPAVVSGCSDGQNDQGLPVGMCDTVG